MVTTFKYLTNLCKRTFLSIDATEDDLSGML